MIKKKKRLGIVVHNVKDFRALKSHKRFVTPFFYVFKVINCITLFLFMGGAIGHTFFNLPIVVSIIFLASYFASLGINYVFFDNFDHRVYVGEDDIAIKYETITMKYNWTDIKDVVRLSKQAIKVTFVDESTAVLKHIYHGSELFDMINKIIHVSKENE